MDDQSKIHNSPLVVIDSNIARNLSDEEMDRLNVIFEEKIQKNLDVFTIKYENKISQEINKKIKVFETKIKSESNEIKKDYLTILGLFASFVTFLLTEVQIFKYVNGTFDIIGISMIVFSMVIFFSLVLRHSVTINDSYKILFTPTHLLCYLFMVIGLIFIWCNDKNKNSVQLEFFMRKSVQDSLRINELKHEKDSLIFFNTSKLKKNSKNIK